MSICSEEEESHRYVESVSDIDVDEFNHRFHEMESEESTLPGNFKKKSSRAHLLEDVGYNCVYRKVDGKMAKVDFFETSSTPNKYIRDAISGTRFLFRTGTSDEDLFYSVRLATGENKRREGATLFYDNPEQYERHFYTTVSQATKDAWLNKVLNARQVRAQTLESASKPITIVR
jgi:hypothetical protein